VIGSIQVLFFAVDSLWEPTGAERCSSPADNSGSEPDREIERERIAIVTMSVRTGNGDLSPRCLHSVGDFLSSPDDRHDCPARGFDLVVHARHARIEMRHHCPQMAPVNVSA